MLPMNDRLFFIVQGFLKYNAFAFGIKLRSFFYKPFFKSFGKGVKIRDGVTIKFPSEIEFGNNVGAEPGCYIVGKGGLKVGDNTLFGAGVKVITSNHNWSDPNIPIRLQGITFKPIVIEEDVWFGFDAKVFGGTHIGKGCIVGTNTLINGKTFEPYSVIIGTPGKVVKSRKNVKENE